MGLFRPTWLSNNLVKALKAVEKENDQAKLTKIAKNALVFEVGQKAVEKITDQAKLTEIVKNALTYEVRLKAVEKMTSQKELACIVQEPCPAYDYDWAKLKEKAIEKLTDQKELAHIAQKPCPAYGYAFAGIKEKAIEKLTDQDVLLHIAQSELGFLRIRAADKLNNRCLAQGIYSDIVMMYGDYNAKRMQWDTHERQMKVASELIEKITDQALLAGIAERAQSSCVAKKAASKIEDENLLMKVAKNIDIKEPYSPSLGGISYSWYSPRRTALLKLQSKNIDMFTEILSGIVRNSKEIGVMRHWGVNTLLDKGVLTEIAESQDSEGYSYTYTILDYVHYDSYDTEIVQIVGDLRMVARERLAEI
ncbi:MAG TPA: hypothetical protein VN608_04540 [Clostridia bacterium]|nr:hypothetical protein [Clostridia bacterium]